MHEEEAPSKEGKTNRLRTAGKFLANIFTNVRKVLIILAIILLAVMIIRLVFYIELVKETYKRGTVINLGTAAAMLCVFLPLLVGLKCRIYPLLAPFILATLVDICLHIVWLVYFHMLKDVKNQDVLDTSKAYMTYFALHFSCLMFEALVCALTMYYFYELFMIDLEEDVELLEAVYYPYRRYEVLIH